MQESEGVQPLDPALAQGAARVIGDPMGVDERVAGAVVLRGCLMAFLGALAGGAFLRWGLGVFVVHAGTHAASPSPTKAGVPAAHVKGDDVARLGGTGARGDVCQLQALPLNVCPQIVVQRVFVRAGHEAQGTRIRADRIEIEGKLDPVAVFGGIDAVIGVPAGVADVAVGIYAHGKGIRAVELRGN